MSKILIITNHSYMLYRFRHELIQELMKKHEVVLSMPFVGHEEDFKKLGIRCIETNVDRRGINPKTDFKLIKYYFDLIRHESVDLVITYSIKPNIYAGLACRILNIPFCANVQGLGSAFQKKGLAHFVTMLYKASMKNVRTVFFENEGNAQEFINRGILKRNKVTVLKGAGINLNDYSFVPYQNNDIFHFLYLGRIMREKGIDELFEAVERLHNDGYSFVLDLVGFFEDEYKLKVDELIEKKIVNFYGFQSDPRPYYEACDCVVLPSYHEGMSNVLLEGAATGRPLITSNIYGCKEAVIDGKSGLLCDVKSSESLYECMKQMLLYSKDERAAMGLYGRRKMEIEFDKHLVVEKTIESLKI